MNLPKAREAALATLSEQVYGNLPSFTELQTRVVNPDARTLEVTTKDTASYIHLALPEGPGPFPTFIGLSFSDSHPDKAWPLKLITDAGFAIATSHYHDWYRDEASNIQTPRAISTWAAALTQIRKAIGGQPEIDPTQAIAIGHSRLGKAALWAAANDEDFAACIAIQSGCGGAGPNQIEPGEEGAERITNITAMFPHWFADQYATWANRESEMPFDQDWLLAAIAPRPILLLNAEDDRWANPSGQDRMAENARSAFPSPNLIQTHTRPGGHEVLPEDWERAIRFAKNLQGPSSQG
jgi:pimeloyl-ACP methyl ester carboxylesterase